MCWQSSWNKGLKDFLNKNEECSEDGGGDTEFKLKKKKSLYRNVKNLIWRFLPGFDFVSGSEEDDKGPVERGDERAAVEDPVGLLQVGEYVLSSVWEEALWIREIVSHKCP